MRRLLILTALAASLFAIRDFAAGVSRKAPEFAIQMVDGPKQLLSMYRGKTVVLAFMFTTCDHCKKTAGVLTQVQKEYASRGVQVLGATFDDGAASRIQQFDKSLGLNFPCGYATGPAVHEFMRSNEPFFVPILVFIDKQGTIRSEYIGDETFLSHQDVNIRAELEKILKGGGTGSSSSTHRNPRS